MKYLIFDFANTLVHKPELQEVLHRLLANAGYDVSLERLRFVHRTLSEVVVFPDKTIREFYNTFNRDFLVALGVPPKDELLNGIYSAASRIAWSKFSDTVYLEKVRVPMAILSNWDTTLPHKVEAFFPGCFKTVIGSELTGLKKPDLAFYKHMLSTLNCDASEVLYVGDSFRLDYMPARELGIPALIVDRDRFYEGNSSLETIHSLEELEKFL